MCVLFLAATDVEYPRFKLVASVDVSDAGTCISSMDRPDSLRFSLSLLNVVACNCRKSRWLRA